MTIYIDADACSVKNEIYKVAARFGLMVIVVANQHIKVPLDVNIRNQVVSDGFDAADDWIVDNLKANDILVTSDLLLADRAVKKKARVLGQKGRELDEENIGAALASRELMGHLRDLGAKNTGPSKMQKSDRSQFLSKLDQMIHSIQRQTKK